MVSKTSSTGNAV